MDLEGLAPGAVAVVFGTRPEIIKVAGIVRLLGDRALTMYSGQHFDAKLSQVFFDDLGLPPCDVVLDVGGRSRAAQIGELVVKLDAEFERRRPAAVVVQGDTNTTVGGALAANARGILLAHVEAGLRSFDRRMPEEHNRVVADHLSDLCLAATPASRANLLAEGVPASRIAVTGNTVVDAATSILPPPAERRRLLGAFDVAPAQFVLATFHRPENVDDPGRLATIISELEGLGLPVLFPVHPRTRARMDASGYGAGGAGAGGGVRLAEPIGYRTFLGLAAESALLVSDSGGVQEEASVVKRPVVVVRRSTERPEVMGTFAVLVPDPAAIGRAARRWLGQLEKAHRELAGLASPYGDGRASERCVAHLSRALAARPRPGDGAGRGPG